MPITANLPYIVVDYMLQVLSRACATWTKLWRLSIPYRPMMKGVFCHSAGRESRGGGGRHTCPAMPRSPTSPNMSRTTPAMTIVTV